MSLLSKIKIKPIHLIILGMGIGIGAYLDSKVTRYEFERQKQERFQSRLEKCVIRFQDIHTDGSPECQIFERRNGVNTVYTFYGKDPTGDILENEYVAYKELQRKKGK